MKTIYLILASIFLATSCKSDETNTEIIKGSPYPPYDYKQMAFYSSFRFVNSSGEALFTDNTTSEEKKTIKVDYLIGDEYFEGTFDEENLRYEIRDDYHYAAWGVNEEGHFLSLVPPYFKVFGEEYIQEFGERLWVQYRITFPDNEVFVVRFTAAPSQFTNVYFVEKVYVNGVSVPFKNPITIVKS